MKYFISLFFSILFLGGAADAVTPNNPRGRASVNSYTNTDARAVVASKNQLAAAAMTANPVSAQQQAIAVGSMAITPEQAVPAVKKDMREKERNACMSNNVGMGNTFVWASRYSNLNNYSTMIEDVEEPENNVCFVKVDIKSNDSKIDVSDIPSKYFEMGRSITCGTWANEETLRQRILDAKKTARVWGTVGGVVGGAGIGVGAMELFGNKLIGGKVEGQKSLQGDQLLRSQLSVLAKENASEYDNYIKNLRKLKVECEKDIWGGEDDSAIESICTKYDSLFDLAS
ncbi:MAG: hypothetical protein UIH99_00565 [Alphaproteobacteria bacterium]|nr:hypothetical protein [Alphaproteobacteria bacterium]